jgi:hypothetical protein
MYSKLIPARTRRLVSIRAAGRCEICATAGVVNFHRTTHERMGHETPADVLALCSGCMVAALTDAAGETWDNPDDMAAHWDAFHHAMEKDD